MDTVVGRETGNLKRSRSFRVRLRQEYEQAELYQHVARQLKKRRIEVELPDEQKQYQCVLTNPSTHQSPAVTPL